MHCMLKNAFSNCCLELHDLRRIARILIDLLCEVYNLIPRIGLLACNLRLHRLQCASVRYVSLGLVNVVHCD